MRRKVLVVGFALALISLLAAAPVTTTASAESAQPGGESRVSQAGQVTITVSWLSESEEPSFWVVMDTHVVDLDRYDLAQLAVLRTDEGAEVAPTAWEITVRRTDAFVALAFHDKKLVTRNLVTKYRELNRDTRLTDLRVLRANGIGGITSAVQQNSFNVRVPTLILWAENDMLFPPSAARRLHRNIPGSALQIIPACRHFLQEEKPEEVNRHILTFLTGPSATRPDGATPFEPGRATLLASSAGDP